MGAPGQRRAANVRDYLREFLDAPYRRLMTPFLTGMNESFGRDTQLKRLLSALEKSEIRGETVLDDPAFKRVMRRVGALLRGQESAYDKTAEQAANVSIDVAGRLTKILSGATSASLAAEWNVPSIDAVRGAIGYLHDRDALGETVSAVWKGIVQDAKNRIQGRVLADLAAGKNALTAARTLRRELPGLTAAAANNALRTLYLESYRSATAIHQSANADMLSHVVRIGTLDSRICMACLALHGTRMEVGERVESHHQCRCTSIAVVKGVARRIETGEDYFGRLPEVDQRRLMGKGAWELWQRGEVQLADFVETYDSAVYGKMIRQATLKELRTGR
jgi:hypothetical protein